MEQQAQPSSKSPSFSTIHKNGLSLLDKLLSPFQKNRPVAKVKENPAINQSCLIKYALNHTQFKLELCSCAHVAIADDDEFQHFYYQSLFQRSLDLSSIFANKSDLRLNSCYSGEDLVKNVSQMLACGCNTLRLVITDYHMGNNKLNGVETARKLREAGYKGIILLRTSEKRSDLVKQHKDFEKMLEEKVIHVVIDKGNLKEGKEIIQSYMEIASKKTDDDKTAGIDKGI